MEWTERTALLGPNHTRSIQGMAEDGHLIRADLLPPQAPGQGPTIMVTCDPVTFDDGADQLERFPTFMELVEAADELAPLSLFNTIFPTYAQPADRPAPPPGARTIPLNWMARVTPPSGIEVVGSIG